MDLKAYLDRIGFAGDPRPDAATLKALHRAHLLAIPYENFDVQLGRTVGLSAEAAFEKLVTRRRGGWCYEMNGLFAAALEAIGFSVVRLAGGVRRDLLGEAMVGNHLVLKVEFGDAAWIADVGFGDGALDPFPLQAGPVLAGGFAYRLEQVNEAWWRFHNHPLGGAGSFDFTAEPADPALLERQCQWLQTSPESAFVLNATAQRHRPGEIVILRGRFLKTVTARQIGCSVPGRNSSRSWRATSTSTCRKRPASGRGSPSATRPDSPPSPPSGGSRSPPSWCGAPRG